MCIQCMPRLLGGNRPCWCVRVHIITCMYSQAHDEVVRHTIEVWQQHVGARLNGHVYVKLNIRTSTGIPLGSC